MLTSDTPENCHFNVKKVPKTFFNCQKIVIFVNGNIFEKKKIFLQFKKKNMSSFLQFLTFKWKFFGG